MKWTVPSRRSTRAHRMRWPALSAGTARAGTVSMKDSWAGWRKVQWRSEQLGVWVQSAGDGTSGLTSMRRSGRARGVNPNFR